MKKFLKYFNVVLLFLLVGVLVYGTTHNREVLDYLALRNYDPPAKVVELADLASMNDKTRNVFYVNHPKIQNKQDFKNSCKDQEKTIVLGCFVSNEGIYLLDVKDIRLDGIVEVTAAHEVLHAMYDRLDSDEKTEVDRMTQAFFAQLSSERIKANIENYRQKDASVVPNELHSILATEVRDLSPELEAYYSKYFKDRKAIVALSEKYEQTFIDIENQVKQYESQLNLLKTEIDSKEGQITQLESRIDSERQRLDSLLDTGRVEEYNASVEGFNALIIQFNGLLKLRQTQASEYNRIVDEYNKLATVEAELLQSLKTSDVQTLDTAE